MSKRVVSSGIVLVGALSLAACSTYGSGPAEYSTTNDTGLGATDGAAAGGSTSSSDKDKRGGTAGAKKGAGGSTAASTPAPSGPGEKEDQRGNTPPGVSRDGQGPAAGAIVDPSGAATKGR